MHIFTDSLSFSEALLGETRTWEQRSSHALSDPIRTLAQRFYTTDTIQYIETPASGPWNHLFIVETAEASQFDVLGELARATPDLPDGILCVAGTGKNFHGFKGRPWTSEQGNLHLSVLVRPRREVERFAVSFTALAVVSVLQTIDATGALRQPPAVKWVNDILIGEAKLGGVLSATHSQGTTVTHAIMGIGLNVESTPDVPPTPFVPLVGSLMQYASKPSAISLPVVFESLIDRLGTNYRILLADGFSDLRELYRSRSMVVGRKIRLHADTAETPEAPVATGTVSAIGDNLELILKDHPAPFTSGRLELLQG